MLRLLPGGGDRDVAQNLLESAEQVLRASTPPSAISLASACLERSLEEGYEYAMCLDWTLDTLTDDGRKLRIPVDQMVVKVAHV